MVKLEQRVGPEGRRLFEKFLRDVNKLRCRASHIGHQRPQRRAASDRGDLQNTV